jgi:hypothetical protein
LDRISAHAGFDCLRFCEEKNRGRKLESTKAELLQESIFFLINLFARDILVMKKLEIEKTTPTFIISFLKVRY